MGKDANERISGGPGAELHRSEDRERLRYSGDRNASAARQVADDYGVAAELVSGKYPTRQVILASYNDDFAERFCRKNKTKIRQFGDKLFQIRIGEIDRATEIELDNHKGRLISRGIRSGITGNPGDLIIIDDPIKSREEADSDTWRDKVWAEWQNSIKSRLSAGAKVVVIMTPWHEDDLAARILATEPNATLLRLPVEAEENDPLGREPSAAVPGAGQERDVAGGF